MFSPLLLFLEQFHSWRDYIHAINMRPTLLSIVPSTIERNMGSKREQDYTNCQPFARLKIHNGVLANFLFWSFTDMDKKKSSRNMNKYVLWQAMML